MIDGVGNVSSVLVVGADNPFCLAIVDRLVGPRLAQVFLLDSDSHSLSHGSQRIHEFGISNVKDIAYRAGDTAAQREIIAALFAKTDIDVVVIGPSPHRVAPTTDTPTSSLLHDAITRTLLDTGFIAERCADAVAEQGHGVICMITHAPSRDIGTRPNLNREYAASMAALNILAPAISTITSPGGGRVVCAAIDPLKDAACLNHDESRRSYVSPLDAASDVVPLIVSRRKKIPFEVVQLPHSFRSTVRRIRPKR